MKKILFGAIGALLLAAVRQSVTRRSTHDGKFTIPVGQYRR